MAAPYRVRAPSNTILYNRVTAKCRGVSVCLGVVVGLAVAPLTALRAFGDEPAALAYFRFA